jgi:sensor c-di-GMP phosphodiesterase-like protein
MREMGVMLGQGYHYHRPQPLDAVLQWLEKQAVPTETSRVLAGSPSIAPEFAA